MENFELTFNLPIEGKLEQTNFSIDRENLKFTRHTLKEDGNTRTEEIPLLQCDSIEKARAMDQLIMIGHYLYYLNEEFREAYDESFQKCMMIADNDLQTFLVKDYFNILYYGLVVNKMVQTMPSNPKYYFERTDGTNADLMAYREEVRQSGKKFVQQPGVPFYCYKKTQSRIMRDFTKKEGMLIINPHSKEVPYIKEYGAELNKIAQCVVDSLLATKDEKARNFVSIFTDKSWSPFLKYE